MPNGTVSRAPTMNSLLNRRTAASTSASGPTMKPGVSHSEMIGSPADSQSVRKSAILSAASASIAPPR